jgi:hypothetical protein
MDRGRGGFSGQTSDRPTGAHFHMETRAGCESDGRRGSIETQAYETESNQTE